MLDESKIQKRTRKQSVVMFPWRKDCCSDVWEAVCTSSVESVVPISCWEYEIGHSGNVYAIEVSRCQKVKAFLFFAPSSCHRKPAIKYLSAYCWNLIQGKSSDALTDGLQGSQVRDYLEICRIWKAGRSTWETRLWCCHEYGYRWGTYELM